MEKFPMTPRGKTKLEERLKYLKMVMRPKIVKEIDEARQHGDLKENAEYHAAKESQSLIEGEVKDTEAKLAMCEVIDPTKLTHSKITFGATVTVEDAESGELRTYALVGEHESDVKAGRLSVTSPMAKALIGKSERDVVEVHTPKGLRELEIVAVKYLPVEYD